MNRHPKALLALLAFFAVWSLSSASGQPVSKSPPATGTQILAAEGGAASVARRSPVLTTVLLAQAPAEPAGLPRRGLSVQPQVAPTTVTPSPQVAPEIQFKPAIFLRSPDGNTKWQTRDQVTISWEVLNIPAQDYLSVELFNYSGTSRIEYLGNSNTGRLDWTIPSAIYKWPGNYRIRVATLDNRVEKISDMFHIGLKTVPQTVTIKADTANKFRSRTRAPSGAFTMDFPPPTADPGPHKMRVGFERRRDGSVDYSWIYRSHVKANVQGHAKKGFLVKATLSYPYLSGDSIEERFCVLSAPWNGQPESLFTVPCDIERIGPKSHDVTSHVRRWLAYPDSNHGFLFFGRDESLGFDTHSRGAATYGDVTLVLEFETAQ